VIACTAVAALASPLLPLDPYTPDLTTPQTPPSRAHWLGTDGIGRDVLARTIYGGRVSLAVGMGAVGLYLLTGMAIGAAAGFFGGAVDVGLMRLADAVLSFPALLVILTLVAITGPSLANIIVVISALGWPGVARQVRAQVLSLREQEFAAAARAIGVSNSRLLVRHLLPNAVAPIVVAATFGIATSILLEASLSFLGLGVQPPVASWGNMLRDALSITVLESMPWLWVPPGLMVTLTVLAINFVGDGLRDAVDPRTYIGRRGG